MLRSESGTVDAESLAGHVAVGNAIKRFKLRKLVTFHQRIAAAREFVDPGAATSLPALLETLRLCPKDLCNVNGGMSAGRGGQLLHEFASHDSVAVLVNARYLTEGIDVPSIDAVVFTDPHQSQIAIVQAVSARFVALGSSRLEPSWSRSRSARARHEMSYLTIPGLPPLATCQTKAGWGKAEVELTEGRLSALWL